MKKSIRKLDDILSASGEAEYLAEIRRGWSTSETSIDDRLLSSLQPEMIRDRWSYAGFEGNVPSALLAMADRIAGSPLLLRFYQHTLWRVYESDMPLKDGMWPVLKRIFTQETRGLFDLLIGLDLVPRLKTYHARLGIPGSVTRCTSQQLVCFCENYQRGHHGSFGIYLTQLAWLRAYTQNRYFRLGRFEFWLRNDRGGVYIFRHRKTREVLALLPDGSKMTPDGYGFGAHSGSGTWTSRLKWSASSITGHPISPFGRGEREAITLSRKDWECVFKPRMPVLDMHIPAGGKMTLEACRDSFLQAASFFQEHFPDEQPEVIICSSWIFNNQLEEILSPEANLVRFQRELYLYPVHANAEDGLWFIFLQDPFDLRTAPRETRLQSAVLDYLEKGNTWRGGGMFFLLDDLPEFGTQYYRRGW